LARQAATAFVVGTVYHCPAWRRLAESWTGNSRTPPRNYYRRRNSASSFAVVRFTLGRLPSMLLDMQILKPEPDHISPVSRVGPAWRMLGLRDNGANRDTCSPSSRKKE
jgi:hypothetical protein